MSSDQVKPIPLHVAASVVQQQLSGSARDSRNDDYGAILDSTALALSYVSDIYYTNAHGRLLRIPAEELAVGMFENGARAFHTRSGNVYESLSMRRGDVAEAIALLKGARGAMRAPGAAEAAIRKEEPK